MPIISAKAMKAMCEGYGTLQVCVCCKQYRFVFVVQELQLSVPIVIAKAMKAMCEGYGTLCLFVCVCAANNTDLSLSFKSYSFLAC